MGLPEERKRPKRGLFEEIPLRLRYLVKRVRRRLLPVTLTTGAVLVIIAAAASGAFQIVVQAVPGYRADVERYVSEVAGRPVRIGALGLTWRYYYPSLELVGVALMSADGKTEVLRAERLRLGFALSRLVRGDRHPDRLELHGLAVDARVTRDGEIKVRGIEGAAAADEPLEALKPLTRFDQLRLERCRLNVRDDRRRGETFSFGIERAELDRGILNEALRIDLALPASLGDSAHFTAAFNGELLDPATWSGTGTLDVSGLAVGRWVQPWLVHGASVETGGVEARIEGRLERGNFKRADLHVRSGPIHGRRARHKAGVDALEARVRVDFDQDGWQAKVRHFTLETVAGRWPPTEAEVRATAGDDGPAMVEAKIDYLRLRDLAPFLQLVDVPGTVAALDGVSGDVRDLTVRVQGEGEGRRYAYRARFEELALPAADPPIGFTGLRGEVAGDERGGRAVLQESRVVLDLPGRLVTPMVPLDAFEAELEWRRRDDAWQFGMPQFRWELWGLRGKGRFELTLPDDARVSPVLDLAAQFMAEDATRAKPLMPQVWGPGLISWLDRSIVSGHAPAAALVIKGPLRDFPFDERATGTFNLDIDAADVVLAYQPDWPPIEDIAASLKFRGNSLTIQATKGVVSGNPLKNAVARFPDFGTAVLLVDGTVSGETAHFYDFLAGSPLRSVFKGLLGQTTASGPSTVDIHLEIPVRDADRTQASGRVQLDGVTLDHGSLPQPIRDIRGAIAFAGQGALTAERLTAKLYELPLEATLAPRADGTSLLAAKLRLAIDPAGKGPSALIPAWLRQKVSGASDWRATLAIGGTGDAPLTLTTDMTGLEVKLPAPLGKPAEQALPLTLTVGGHGGAGTRITADLEGRFGADLRFAKARGAALAVERGALRLGAGPTAAPEERGLVLGGQLAELDARAWADALGGSGLETEIQSIRRADVQVGRAVWDRYALRDARFQWTAQRGGWTLALSGTGGAGEVKWSAADRGLLTARLDQLTLELLDVDDTGEGEPANPNALPLFDVDVGRLRLNETDLGHLQLASVRTEAGQRLRTLKVDGGAMTLTADGEWRRRAGQSSAAFNADLATGDIAALLRAFGYTPNLDARTARFKGALTWMPSERGIEWHQAQGTVHLEFENGQLRAVEPGAGRVLGLVNFYALPRRLTLNFRDVLGSGLGFDRVEGDFELRDGNARTQNLRINGPSLRMDVTGRIGLAARDYDQQVTVYPDVSAGVTLGAVLLGGPVAGALALIAQEILNKPLDQVTQLSYRVTGSWDNPQVERAANPEAPRRQRPPGSPSK